MHDAILPKPVKLVDCVERHSLYPRSFAIPPEDSRRTLDVGDYAKLFFLCPPGSPSEESMWVRITHVTRPGVYVGALDNEPVFCTLKWGALVAFEARHIGSILKKGDEP